MLFDMKLEAKSGLTTNNNYSLNAEKMIGDSRR